MPRVSSIGHHYSCDEQLFFTWLLCGYTSILRKAHELTIDLNKRLEQKQSPFPMNNDAGKNMWRAVKNLPTKESEPNKVAQNILLARIARKKPLFLLIYQGLLLKDARAYSEESASGLLLCYFFFESPINISHETLMDIHQQLSQWIFNTIEINRKTDIKNSIKSFVLFYFHEYTAKTTQQNHHLPLPPVVALLKNELINLYENSQKTHKKKIFGQFSQDAVTAVLGIFGETRATKENEPMLCFLMTFLDAIARVYVYAECKNTLEQMLACEYGTLLKFLLWPFACCIAFISLFFFENNYFVIILKLSLLVLLYRLGLFFFNSHAFDHYYNACRLVDYLKKWTDAESEKGFCYWEQRLDLSQYSLIPSEPNELRAENVLSKPSMPEYWYPSNYTHVIYSHLRSVVTKIPRSTAATTIVIKKVESNAIEQSLTWTINGTTYTNKQRDNTTPAFPIKQSNLPSKTPFAYYAAISPEVECYNNTQPFKNLLSNGPKFVGKTGQGIKMLKNGFFELKLVGHQGKNDQRMISDPTPYEANEEKKVRLLLFARPPMNHTQIRNNSHLI